MRNASNALYNDGLRPTATSNTTCANDQGPMWSYCQGLPIGYDIELHTLTGEPRYLTDALTIFAGVRGTLTAPASWPAPPPSSIHHGRILPSFAVLARVCPRLLVALKPGVNCPTPADCTRNAL